MKQHKIDTLLDVMVALRNPTTGCPWDIKQNFETIAPYTIEEAYEVLDAIQRKDMENLREELGDLLLQVVYHAQMADEQEHFDFADVVSDIIDKMIRRHPHVFGSEDERKRGPEPGFWDRIKANENKGKSHKNSLLDDVPVALPALMRATKLQKKAAKVGFDWPSLDQVFDKMHEELAELEAELKDEESASTLKNKENQKHTPQNIERITEEFGDLLFVMANVARHLKVNPEDALHRANQKFIRRFKFIEDEMRRENKELESSTLEEMDKLWNEAKTKEKPVP